jgi:hypothetical protein
MNSVDNSETTQQIDCELPATEMAASMKLGQDSDQDGRHILMNTREANTAPRRTTSPEAGIEELMDDIAATCSRPTLVGCVTQRASSQASTCSSGYSQATECPQSACMTDTDMKYLGNSYSFILKTRQSSQKLPDLDGGNSFEMDLGSFTSNNDARIQKVHVREDFNKNQIFTLSFNPSTNNCERCWGGAHTAFGKGGGNTPVALIMADQHFPPILPARGEGGCLFVVRLEHALLWELVDTLLEMARDLDFPNGSTILLGSVSHLATLGQQSNAERVTAEAGRLAAGLGGRVTVLPAPLVAWAGCNVPMVIRGLFDFNSWLCSLQGFPIAESAAAATSDLFLGGVASHNQNLTLFSVLRPPLHSVEKKQSGSLDPLTCHRAWGR